MFGTRANWLIDLSFLITLLAPFIAGLSIRIARKFSYGLHKRIQSTLLIVCIFAVLLLEVCIRLAGGSGALLESSPFSGTGLVRAILGVHIVGAVLTYFAWGWLAIRSSKRYQVQLPGTFSQTHKRLGWLVFIGLCFTSFSASIMYVLAFIA